MADEESHANMTYDAANNMSLMLNTNMAFGFDENIYIRYVEMTGKMDFRLTCGKGKDYLLFYQILLLRFCHYKIMVYLCIRIYLGYTLQ